MIIEYKSSSSGRTMINLDNVTNIRAYNKTVCVTFVNGEDINFESHEVTELSWIKLMNIFSEW